MTDKARSTSGAEAPSLCVCFVAAKAATYKAATQMGNSRVWIERMKKDGEINSPLQDAFARGSSRSARLQD
jgi:hypothetical protein